MARPQHEQLERDLTRSYEALQAGRPAEAEVILKRGLARSPDEPRLTANLLQALERLGRHDEALTTARRAVAVHPEVAHTHTNLATLLKFAGALDEARAHYRRAVELAPGNAEAWRALAALKRFTDPRDPDLAAMTTLLGSLPPADPGRIPLHFAIARALEDLGQLDEAFVHYERGSRMKRAHLRYDPDALDRAYERAYSAFATDFLARGPIVGACEDDPVLVVGMPRSGTTLVEQVLASHPALVGVGECTELERVVQGLGADATSRLEALARLPDAELARLGAEYAARLKARAGDGHVRVVDKSLDNHLYVGFLARALPNARVVHVVREPLDNVLSCLRVLFASPLAYTYDQTELVRAYAAVNRLGERWRERLPENVYRLSYEALVADQLGETQRLLAWLGLPWADACLAFERTERRVDSASSLQVRQPLFSTSVGAARRFERHLKPAIAALVKLGLRPRG